MTPNVAASVSARLLAIAKAKGEEFQLTLTRFAAERILYRLGSSPARGRVLLKGASLISVWLANPYRATSDIDVLAFGESDEGAIRALIEQVCAEPCPEDGLAFDLETLTVEPIREREQYPGHRARFLAHLGAARIGVQVDFGFGDAVFEAMVKLDTRNSRMKDFHDIWALSLMLPFDGPRLSGAVLATFERRGTPWTSEMPRALTPAFYQVPELSMRWRSYVAKDVILVPPPGQFEMVGEQIIRFLGPIRASVIGDLPFTSSWPPGGPWR